MPRGIFGWLHGLSGAGTDYRGLRGLSGLARIIGGQARIIGEQARIIGEQARIIGGRAGL